MKVICIKPILTLDEGDYTMENDVYKVGYIYNAEYHKEKVFTGAPHPSASGSKEIYYEWKVDCGMYGNHYQFTQREFDEYFTDVIKQREEKISLILNI